jgi:cysteine desulfurase / selenocysteine lyase
MNTQHIRLETKGIGESLFLNSAGSSLMPDVVVDAMTDYLEDERLRGGYEVWEQRQPQIAQFYTEVARLIQAKPNEISFASSSSDAFAKALSSIPFKRGDVILTTNDDYVSNQFAFISLKQRLGIEFVRMNKPNGTIDLERVEYLVRLYNPKLVAVTHIPTNSGIVQDVVGIGKICKQYGVLYMVDACQSVGQMPVDVNAMQCDFLTATGRKFMRGPRGTGFLFASTRVLDMGLMPMFFDGRGADWTGDDSFTMQPSALRYELFEYSFPARAGFTAAIEYANDLGLQNIYNYNQILSIKMRQLLAEQADIKLLDRPDLPLSNIITFKTKQRSLETMMAGLKQHNVLYSVAGKGSAFIDMSQKQADWAIRFSPHYFNTPEEVEAVCAIVAGVK